MTLGPVLPRFRLNGRALGERLFPRFFQRETVGGERWVRFRSGRDFYAVDYPVHPADPARHREHRRAFFQWMLVVGGSGFLTVSGKKESVALTRGDSVFLGPLHGAHFTPSKTGLHVASFAFRPSVLWYPDECVRDPRLARLFPLLGLFQPDRETPRLVRLPERLFLRALSNALHGIEQFHSERGRFPHASQLRFLLELHLPYATPEEEAVHSPAIDEALHFLASRFRERIGLGALSAHCRLSPSHFSRRFHAETGMGLRAWLNQLRIGEAKRLLRETRLPIHRIAGEAGYEGVEHFNGVFRRLVGMTPGNWRMGDRAQPSPKAPNQVTEMSR